LAGEKAERGGAFQPAGPREKYGREKKTRRMGKGPGEKQDTGVHPRGGHVSKRKKGRQRRNETEAESREKIGTRSEMTIHDYVWGGKKNGRQTLIICLRFTRGK